MFDFIKGETDPNYGTAVSVNIYEAVAEDIRTRNGDNAIAGGVLAKHRPGLESDPNVLQSKA